MLRISSACMFLVLAACRPAPPPPPTPAGLGPPLAAEGSPLSMAGAPRPRAAPWCGAPLVVAEALPDPGALPDREGEWLRLVNPDVAGVSLDGWAVESAGRRVALDGLVLDGGGALRLGGPDGVRDLGAVRLANRGDQVDLVDPCDQRVASLSWGMPRCFPPAPDERVLAPGPWPGMQFGPTRQAPSGADGGCGQS